MPTWRRGRAAIAASGAVVALAATLLAGPSPVSAATSQYDAKFAAGYETVDFRGTDDQATGVAIDSSARILIGATTFGTTDVASFVRLSSSGAIDTTFGTAGNANRVFVPLPESVSLLGFALAPGGKIVGLAENHEPSHIEYLFRLNQDGSLDTATDADPTTHFGTGGIVTITPPTGTFDAALQKVVVTPTSQVVLAGRFQSTVTDPRFVRVRAFSATGGSVYSENVSLGPGSSDFAGLALSPSGSQAAVLMRSEGPAGHDAIGLLAINASTGAPDTSFSGDGKLVVGSATRDVPPEGVTYTWDGKIVIAAIEVATSSLPQDTLVVRYSTDGTLDHTMDHDGFAHSAAPVFGRINSIFTVTTGRTTVVGEGNSQIVDAMALTSTGSPDTAFDGDGALSVLPPEEFVPTAAIPASNGRTVAVGTVDVENQGLDVGILRLNSDGQGDPLFGNVAYRHYPMSQADDDATSITLAPDGGAVVAASTFNDGDTHAALMKLLPNGYRDPAFGFEGLAIVLSGTLTDSEARAVGMHGPKAVFAGCNQCLSGNSSFLVGQLTATGDPDTAFSGDGIVTNSFGTADAEANGLAVQSNGRIVVVGKAGNNFAVARYKTSGVLDTSFGGGDGKVTTDIASGSVDEAFDVAIQADGKIVVAGVRNNGTDFRFALVRYTAAGVLDTTFGGGDGIVVTKVGSGSAAATAVAIRPDGRIIVAGFTEGNAVALVRYKKSGALDAGFNGDGKVTASLTPTGSEAFDVAAVGNTIVVVGSNGTNHRELVARFLDSGAVDTSFSGDGWEVPAFPSETARGVAIQADGKIVVAGNDISALTGDDTIVARYNP